MPDKVTKRRVCVMQMWYVCVDSSGWAMCRGISRDKHVFILPPSVPPSWCLADTFLLQLNGDSFFFRLVWSQSNFVRHTLKISNLKFSDLSNLIFHTFHK